MTDLQYKREQVFWILSAVFLSSMAMLNIIGLTKFVNVFGLSVAVGILPYPITFLCTDLISELYGKKRANFIVWLGFFINLMIFFFVWLAQNLPAVDLMFQPPWQTIELAKEVFYADGTRANGEVSLFSFIYKCTAGSVMASMVAYLAAQLCDVHLFHYFKALTKGKHLWLRNNFSTLVSQLVDSLAVIGITFGAAFMRGEIALGAFLVLIGSNYAFKVGAALLDTPFFYFFTTKLKKELEF